MGFFESIAKPFESVGKLLVKGFEAVGSMLMQAVTFSTSLLTSRMFASTTPDYNAQNAGANARIQATPNTTTPIPVGYGDFFMGGKFVDACLTSNGIVMYYVLAISGIAESNASFTYDKTKIYYGDRLVTFSSTNPSTVISLTDNAGNVDTKIADQLSISLFTSDKNGNITNHTNPGQMPWGAGNAVMGPDSGLISSQQWASTNRRMNGLAFAIVRLSYKQDAGTTQLSPITFKCRHTLYGADYINPGAVWVDYMTNPIYGCAVDIDYVDTDSAYALDVYSNELITFKDYNGVSQTQPRYRVNGVLNTGLNVLQNIDQIMNACDSWMQYNAATGKWAIVVNKAEAPSMAFDDSNILGSITVSAVDLTQTPNQIEAKFPDKTNRDQYNYVNEKVPPELLFPNEPINKLTVTYELTNDSVQALYLANRVLEQNREDLLVTINTTYDGIQVNAGDVISITNAAYGWTDKLFRAMQVREEINSDYTLSASIQCIEYNSQVYDDKDITQYVPAGNSDLVAMGYFSPLSAPTVTDQQPNAAVPSFSVQCLLPATGIVTTASLYYTTIATPTVTDWKLLGVQSNADLTPFASSSYLKFTNISLPTNTYYFAFSVANTTATSALSPISITYTWLPNPTTSAVAGTFVATFSPSVLQVPYDGTSATFSGIIAQLYGTTAGGSVDFVDSQDDTDPLFTANTWRIGGSSTTGFADILESNITIADPTDGGSYALFPIPTAMSGSPATLDVPVRYKDSLGNVVQGATASLQYTYNIVGNTGATGRHYSTALLYQWATTTPSNPNGNSTFIWATNTNTSYTGTNGWEVDVPANPGIPLARLYSASKGISAIGSDVTTSVDWSTGFSVQAVSENGAAGLQTAQPTVFQWAVTIPSGPTGTSTYTWATSSFTPTPSGWSLTAGTTPSPGYTLWAATVTLTDSATVTTSSINWTTAGITARGFSGETGASARICYTKTTLAALASTPTTITTSGSSSFPPNNSWGTGTVWQATPPAIVAGESVYQSDGIYSPTTGNTVWNVPYISALKVGTLEAITANMGSLISGTITGALIRTAATGKRVVMDYSTNDFSVYNASGTLIAQLGGTSNSLYVLAGLSTQPGAGVYNNSTFVPAIYGSNETTTNTGDNCAGVQGNGTVAHGVMGRSTSSGYGVFGKAYVTGGSNHGVKGVNIATSGTITTTTSGLVGVANGYDFYADGAGTNYGPFTGAHDVMVPVAQDIPVGYIVNDVKCLIKKNISNTVFEVTMSSAPNQVPIGIMVLNNGLLANQVPAAFVEKTVYTDIDGIESSHQVLYPEYDEYKNDYNYCAANAVGEGQVYVCGEAGNIAAGDLIVTSSTPGVGMKQADDIVRSITVAKAREAVIFTNSDPVLVPCIYLCG